MIIWLLALVLFGCLGVAGYSFGGVRASITFFGILVSVLLAKIFGHMLTPLLGSAGVKNPIAAWLVAPVIVFIIGVSIFKIIALYVHRKIDVYYKYKAGDLRMALWLRLNARTGLCVGMLNATAYLILISLCLYITSQVTYQLSSGDNAKWIVRMANMAGKQLQSSGMARVAAAIDPMPATFYETADMMGLIYHNPLLEARLGSYPAFLSLAEKPPFQAIADNRQFAELRQRQPPIADILNDPLMAEVVKPEMLREIWGIVLPNLQDLDSYLRTGISKTYDEPLLGRWEFNMNAALGQVRVQKPDIRSAEMQRTRAIMIALFSKTTFVAMPKDQGATALFKQIGKLRPAPAAPAGTPPPTMTPRGGRGGTPPPRGGAPPANQPPAQPQITVDLENAVSGKWNGGGGNYELNFGNRGKFDATVEGDKLVVSGYGYPLVFEKQY